MECCDQGEPTNWLKHFHQRGQQPGDPWPLTGISRVGEKSEKALDELITLQKQSGVYPDLPWRGNGKFQRLKLQTLAKKEGNGNYAYLDDIAEAEKSSHEIDSNLYAVADDVSMNVSFNPAMVKQYRLIRFDNKGSHCKKAR